MDDSVPFKVVELPGRGKGMIATRRIEQGELLLREEPLFLVPPTTNESPTSIIANLVASLSPSARTAFFALAHHDTTLPPPAIPLAIFETNAINAGEDGIGIFPRTARLNHGCSSAFNAVYSWRHRENALVVHAIRRIEKGQELLTTYTDTKRPRRERRAFTSESYGFKCQCAVCTLPPALSAASDARLEKLTQLKARFTTWGSGAISGAVAIGLAREMWAVGEEEGYISEWVLFIFDILFRYSRVNTTPLFVAPFDYRRGQLAADAAHVAAAHKEYVQILTHYHQGGNGVSTSLTSPLS
ncbi:hypothetical protein BOTBODRAFT_285874 [Botryobasidium botryosum FD-172 SS1]|uniref:SET domain-containing protein n=1 Tax=Botryobasidium botryosum (strain FD-172 SS1) TaxID=930990 RepID=A0A067MJH3_BOTB1|nr:hypothetical protein BOTBODRAFT_285874 [Botryobasidium botryosum FD-172 SS1]